MKKMRAILTLFLSFIMIHVSAQGISLPYNSGFDSAPEKAGWVQYRTGFLSFSGWSYGGGAFSAPTCVSHDYNVGGNSNDTVVDWFVSPPLNLTAPGALSLKVQTGGFSTPFPDSFEILYGTDHQDPANGNFVVIANLSYMLPQSQWLDTTITLPYVSDSAYIALKYKTIGAAWSTYAFDNISITSTASINESLQVLMNCFPNPFSEQLTIKTDKELKDATLSVYNAYGQLVRQTGKLAGRTITIDRENLPCGLYYLRLTENEKETGYGKITIAY